MTQFQKLVAGLEQAKVPCNVKLFNTGGIAVECGWNYPDEVYEQVYDVAKPLGLFDDTNDFSICAEVHGGVLEIQQRVFGGPKRYSY